MSAATLLCLCYYVMSGPLYIHPSLAASTAWPIFLALNSVRLTMYSKVGCYNPRSRCSPAAQLIYMMISRLSRHGTTHVVRRLPFCQNYLLVVFRLKILHYLLIWNYMLSMLASGLTQVVPSQLKYQWVGKFSKQL